MKLKMTKKKLLAAIVSTALLCGVGVGGTVAWLHVSSSVTNTFTPGEISGDIDEDFDYSEKKNVHFTNTGTADAYVRAVISMSVVDGAGNIVDVDPEEVYETYSVANENEGWLYNEADGFYYYRSPLAEGKDTSNLIHSIKAPNEGEYYLRVDVSAQFIQASPTSVVTSVWGVKVDENGNLTLK